MNGIVKETGGYIFLVLDLAGLTILIKTCANSQMENTAESIIRLYEKRDIISGLKMTYESEYLRFFQDRFEKLSL
ncbi:MAG: hypothetical protein KGD58_02335 [Candidatus Lokiarchaeota archaeon]|nr:hypothetical protein [Candidatus Lokiarchaeota archaeon]